MPRLWILSDLHRDIGYPPFTPSSIPDADVAIIAGDVCESLTASVAWVAQTIARHMPVVMVAGNHEFYGHVLADELDRGRAAARAHDGIHLLENASVTVADIRFSGCTLWTDYALYGAARQHPSMNAARQGLLDHRRILWSAGHDLGAFRRFGPEMALHLHGASRLFLTQALFEDEAQVVVTHHAPSPGSVHPRWSGDPLTPAFVSDLTDLIQATQPALWVHGHTHSSFDYRVGSTRLLCNPKGYGGENPSFKPELVIELEV